MVVHSAQLLKSGAGPITVQYRVNAGPLPKGHWYADPREGGLLLGEVCHFIDTAQALVESRPVAVSCSGPNADLHDTYAVLIEYLDGSIATITYAADGNSRTPKERCEVTGRKQTVVIDDYRNFEVDGKHVKVHTGKGHVESLEALAQALRTGDQHPARSAIETTATAIAALRALKERTVVEVPRVTDALSP